LSFELYFNDNNLKAVVWMSTLVAATYHITAMAQESKDTAFVTRRKLASWRGVLGTDYLTDRKRLTMSPHSFSSSLEWIKLVFFLSGVDQKHDYRSALPESKKYQSNSPAGLFILQCFICFKLLLLGLTN
jgi:hypothetical protein